MMEVRGWNDMRRSHEPRNKETLKKLKKARKLNSPLQPLEEVQPCRLISAH